VGVSPATSMYVGVSPATSMYVGVSPATSMYVGRKSRRVHLRGTTREVTE